MAWLGVRCWKNRIALVVIDDHTDGPRVLFRRREGAPERGSDHGPHVAWFHRVVSEVIEEARPEGVAVRVANSDPEQVRAECEGAVAVAAAQRGLPAMSLRQQGMWKPLGLPNAKAATWKAFQSEDSLIGSLVQEEKDAAMASLAAARRCG